MFRQQLRSSDVQFGFYLHFPSPELTELMGHLGFDYVLVDAEHFTFGTETVQRITRAAQLTGMTPLIRVQHARSDDILTYLEAGMTGIVVPGMVTADDARAAVQAVKYPPDGARGAGSTTRAANYGLTQSSAEYFAAANEKTVVLGMVESEAGIRNLPEILAVDGVDGLSVGRGDLALSMGYPGQTSEPAVAQLVQQALDQIRDSDKALGLLATSAEGAVSAQRKGAVYITLSLSSLLKKAARGYLVEARNACD